MKKKNLITAVASVAMVGVIAVGSTLAYLSANDKKLTNTFTFANGITVDVFEEDTIGKGNVSGGIDYTNLVAGQTLDKDVDVTVTTTVNTYVYIKVAAGQNGTTEMNLDKTQITNNGWTALNAEGGAYQVYYKEVKGTTESDDFNFGVFETVTVPDGDGTASLKDIIIDVYAVQAYGFTDAVTAYNQLTEDGTVDIFAD